MSLDMHTAQPHSCITHTQHYIMGKHKQKGPRFSNHWLDLANNLANDITFHKLFSNSLTKDSIQEATEYLRTHLESLLAPTPMTQKKELFSDFINFCMEPHNSGSISVPLKKIINDWQVTALTQHVEHRRLVNQAGLNWKSPNQIICCDAKINAIWWYDLLPLATAYPPAGKWVLESSKTEQLWVQKLLHNPQPDRRLKWHLIQCLVWEQLALNVPPNADAIIYDAQTGHLALLVLRNFCMHPGLLDFIDEVVNLAVAMKQSIQVCF